MKTNIVILIIILTLVYSCQTKLRVQPIHIIPEPVSVETLTEQPFQLKQSSRIIIDQESMIPSAKALQKILKQELPIIWKKDAGKNKSDIIFEIDHTLDSLGNEGYVLNITNKNIKIRSAGEQGLFYGVETIRQLTPPELEKEAISNLALPAVEIIDSPRFPWRGMHLDVSRHFMPLDFIKKYIDYLALHKLNVFHWHLVDGIGWRIEIKSHPELTDVGAWRVVKKDKKPWQDFEVWKAGDTRKKYGGYYTQEEIKEVVAYAKERYITVLPEIELPGHSEVVFQCYPNLLCKDHKHNSLNNIGVYCASNPKSYQLLEDILDEVIKLFPSEYIHIGGDEVNKINWEKCANCQKLMKENKYSTHELQSHFVNHFDEYLKSKGRKLIGWHEILEGELSESATIMYWGGENGVAGNMKKGHPTVLTTGSHLYFDHYQSLSKEEPKAFGGYSSLKKIYNYKPIPAGLDAKYSDLIIGLQANVWTEYIPTVEHAEYMTMPRMAALAEVAWQAEETKNWQNFREKMDYLIEHYEALNINYARSGWRPNIQFELNKVTKNINVALETELLADIYYTTDGSEPNIQNSKKYDEAFILEKSSTIKAIAVKNGKILVPAESKEAILHKARGAKISVSPEPKGKYSAAGGYTLVDTDFGGDKWGNGKWLGMLSRDFTTTMEFEQTTKISTIGYSCIEETSAGIYFPAEIEVAVSDNGTNFETIKSWESNRKTPIERSPDIKTQVIDISFQARECKYLKVTTKYQRVSNTGVFVFVDEIIVD